MLLCGVTGRLPETQGLKAGRAEGCGCVCALDPQRWVQSDERREGERKGKRGDGGTHEQGSKLFFVSMKKKKKPCFWPPGPNVSESSRCKHKSSLETEAMSPSPLSPPRAWCLPVGLPSSSQDANPMVVHPCLKPSGPAGATPSPLPARASSICPGLSPCCTCPETLTPSPPAPSFLSPGP